jgi:hypothetical protein
VRPPQPGVGLPMAALPWQETRGAVTQQQQQKQQQRQPPCALRIAAGYLKKGAVCRSPAAGDVAALQSLVAEAYFGSHFGVHQLQHHLRGAGSH